MKSDSSRLVLILKKKVTLLDSVWSLAHTRNNHCSLLALCSGFHLSVIHNQPDVLDRLLFIMSKERALRSVIDEQNRLYQVRNNIISVPCDGGRYPLKVAANQCTI